jgi:hypothetical protein
VSTCRTDFAIIVDYKHDRTDIGVVSASKMLSKHYKMTSRFSSLATVSRVNGSRFYATHNPNIGWISGEGDKSKRILFGLNRIKYNYTIYFTKPGLNGTFQKLMIDIPGEVLDLSHGHNDDRKKIKFDRPIAQLDFLQQFQFLNNNLDYLSYSLKGHINDIGSIIFSETGYAPWLDQKYNKRIQRIIIIAALLYFNQRSRTYTEKLAKMTDIINAIEAVSNNSSLQELTGNTVIDQLAHDIVYSIKTGIRSNDNRVEEFRATCLDNLRKMYKALQAQQYYTQNQVMSYSTNPDGSGLTGLMALPLNLDYPNIYL